MIDCRRWQPIWFTQEHGLLPETRCASLPQAQDVRLGVADAAPVRARINSCRR
jgi:hypothetical protein